MKLFDDLSESVLRVWTKLEKKCPVCGHDLDITPELTSKRFPIIECEQCHFRLEFNTRNNARMTFAAFFIPVLSFALGLIVRSFF